jgi:hypothetical protein
MYSLSCTDFHKLSNAQKQYVYMHIFCTEFIQIGHEICKVQTLTYTLKPTRTVTEPLLKKLLFA